MPAHLHNLEMYEENKRIDWYYTIPRINEIFNLMDFPDNSFYVPIDILREAGIPIVQYRFSRDEIVQILPFIKNVKYGPKGFTIFYKNDGYVSYSYDSFKKIKTRSGPGAEDLASFTFGASSAYGLSDSPEVYAWIMAFSTIPAISRLGREMLEAAGNFADDFINAANQPFKNGQFTVAGRALTKHPNIVGANNAQDLYKIFGNQNGINQAATNAVSNFIANGITTTKIHSVFGKVIDFKLSSGLGVRFNAVTKEFIHFLGRGVQ